MIKNVIFDLGNVLISFVPSEFLKKKNYPENIRNTILADIFSGKEWAMLDNGDITTAEAIVSIAGTSRLKKEEIEHIFNLRTEIMFPLDYNVRLLPALKKQGFKLYFLSNFPLDIFEDIRNDYYFFRYFDGGIISSEAKLSKPDIRIFELIIQKYGLKASETLFIDDIPLNVETAVRSGMKGYVTLGSDKIAGEVEKLLGITEKTLITGTETQF